MGFQKALVPWKAAECRPSETCRLKGKIQEQSATWKPGESKKTTLHTKMKIPPTFSLPFYNFQMQFLFPLIDGRMVGGKCRRNFRHSISTGDVKWTGWSNFLLSLRCISLFKSILLTSILLEGKGTSYSAYQSKLLPLKTVGCWRCSSADESLDLMNNSVQNLTIYFSSPTEMKCLSWWLITEAFVVAPIDSYNLCKLDWHSTSVLYVGLY